MFAAVAVSLPVLGGRRVVTDSINVANAVFFQKCFVVSSNSRRNLLLVIEEVISCFFGDV